MEKNILNQFFIYQLNTRIFCIENNCKLPNFPESFFSSESVLASDFVWLMGVWLSSQKSVEICKSHDGLKQEFQKSLDDFTEDDILGSPYSIFDYIPNSIIANHKLEIKQFRYKLNTIDKKLILDFVPNHVSVDSILIDKYPEYFLYKKNENPTVCKNSFQHKNGKIYFYGRDPYFDGWTDTVQWDFSNPNVSILHTKILLDLTEICDGVRCDMAMLPLESVFEKTHGIKAAPYWKQIIETVKERREDFIFIAEVYWNMEYELQQLGFDFTYDKTLYDRLKKQDAKEIFEHLQANRDYQTHSLRFIENHDEERAYSHFGKNSIHNFSLISFLEGSILYHEGQELGAVKKVPVQLGRRKLTSISEIKDFYTRAFKQIQSRKEIESILITSKLKPYEEDNLDYSIVKFLISKNVTEILIFNPYPKIIYAQLELPFSVKSWLNDFKKEDITFIDILDNQNYIRNKKELNSGIHIELNQNTSHWFVFQK